MDTVDLKGLSTEEFCDFLTTKGFSDQIVENFRANGLNGEAFLRMDDHYFSEVAQRIIDRMNLKQLQEEYSKVSFYKKNKS